MSGQKVIRSRGEVDPYWHQRHDEFNLIYLPFVVATIINYGYYYIQNPASSDVDSAYVIMSFVFLLYSALDTLWIIAKPNSVASPSLIIIHHIIAIIASVSPIYSKAIRLYQIGGTTVELNTWLLILRRYLRDRYVVIELPFYTTWIIIRVILYPYILYRFTTDLVFDCNSLQFRANGLCWQNFGFGISVIILNVLNSKWSIDLVYNNFIRKDKKSKGL